MPLLLRRRSTNVAAYQPGPVTATRENIQKALDFVRSSRLTSLLSAMHRLSNEQNALRREAGIAFPAARNSARLAHSAHMPRMFKMRSTE